MASTVCLCLFGSPLRARHAHNAHVVLPRAQDCRPMRSSLRCANRRELLFSLTAATVLTARESASKAEDIPLFGLRKKLRKAEEEAVEVVREGFEAAEKGLESAEKGLESAERGIQAAERGIEVTEREIETAVSFGGLAQAAAVAGAEAVGVLVTTSVVNGILGPESQKS